MDNKILDLIEEYKQLMANAPETADEKEVKTKAAKIQINNLVIYANVSPPAIMNNHSIVSKKTRSFSET